MPELLHVYSIRVGDRTRDAIEETAGANGLRPSRLIREILDSWRAECHPAEPLSESETARIFQVLRLRRRLEEDPGYLWPHYVVDVTRLWAREAA